MRNVIGFLMAMVLVGCNGDDGGDDTGASTDDSGTGGQHPALSLTGDATAGSTVYGNSCGLSTCHGADGAGTDSEAADLAGQVPALSDEALVGVIVNGVGSMPPQYLEDQQIADVLAYLNQEFGG